MGRKLTFLLLVLAITKVAGIASTPNLDSLYSRALAASAVNLDSTELLATSLLRESLRFSDYKMAGNGAYLVGYVYDERNMLLNAGLRYYEALQYLRKAPQQAIETEINVLISLGRVNNLAGRVNETLSLYDEALELVDDESSSKSMIMYNIGYAHYSNNDYPTAMQVLLEAYELAKKTGNYRRASNCLNYIGLCLYYTGQYSSAREYFERILDARDQLKDNYVRAAGQALHNIGNSYFEEGFYEKALKSYYDALQMERQLPDSSQQFATLMDLGELMLVKTDTLQAMKYLEQAAAIFHLRIPTPESFKVFQLLEKASYKRDPLKNRKYIERLMKEWSAYLNQKEQLQKEHLGYEMERIEAQVAERIAQYEKIEKWMSRAYLIAPIIIIIGVILFFIYKRNQKKKHRQILKLISEV